MMIFNIILIIIKILKETIYVLATCQIKSLNLKKYFKCKLIIVHNLKHIIR